MSLIRHQRIQGGGGSVEIGRLRVMVVSGHQPVLPDGHRVSGSVQQQTSRDTAGGFWLQGNRRALFLGWRGWRGVRLRPTIDRLKGRA